MNKITIRDLYLLFASASLFKVHIITEENGKWMVIGDYDSLSELYESERQLSLYMDAKEDELILNKRVLWFDVTGQTMLIRVE